MTLPKNFSSWKFTSKVIRQIHNTDVVKHFKDVKKDDDLSRGRSALKAGLVIRAKDSALDILNKQIVFRLGVEKNNSSDSILSFPEGWVLKPGDDIPQLAIVYKIKELKSGYNTIHIPHYNGQRNPKFPPLKKGIKGVILELKDNSKIIIYANNHDYGRDYISRYLLPLVEQKYRTSDFKNVVRNNVRAGTALAVRADYYSKGKSGGNIPDWRH
ncbi:MAG: hypothetical protein RLZZ74_3593, partial [Cyanobacteriota bacterium]